MTIFNIDISVISSIIKYKDKKVIVKCFYAYLYYEQKYTLHYYYYYLIFNALNILYINYFYSSVL